jgi:hypothetical protein
MSERATLALHGAAGDVTLRVTGESSLRYFPRPSRLSIVVADQVIAVIELGRDFTTDVRVPAALITKSGGQIAFLADQMFIPGDREGTADRRHLAVRLYSVTASQ